MYVESLKQGKKVMQMAVKCKICGGDFKTSPDSIVLCEHKDGVVHLGCCVNNCSMNKAPCKHCVATYDKL